jgi:hypothetical protein
MREVIVAFRVTVLERDRLKSRAKESNQSVSDLIITKIIQD